MATPPLPSISPAAEKSSESMASPPSPSSIFELMATLPPLSWMLRRAEKSSKSMVSRPPFRSIYCRICLWWGRDDSPTAVEDDKSKEKDVGFIMGMAGLGRASLSRPTKKLFYEDDSDYFLSTQKSKDEKPASNLEPWRLVSPQGYFKRKITSWRKCKKLGKGMDADFYEVMTDDGSFFTVKAFPLLDQGSQGSQSLSQLEQEIKLYRRFEHENIVQCIGTDKDDENLYVFLELMSKGSLSTLYCKRPLTESQVSAYTSQILKGLKHIHDQNVIHRDINCANILVDASGSVKLTGFRLAEATKMNAAKSLKGTFRWMAPEVLNSGKNGSYGLTADIWSLGCTVLEMLTCKPPYSNLGEGTAAQKRSFVDRMAAAEVWSALVKAQVLEKIRKGEPPRVPKFLSEDAQEFICRCLQQNPKERPSEAQLLDHPFVRDPPTSGFA